MAALSLTMKPAAKVQWYSSLYFPPIVVFVVVLVTSIFAWQGAKASLRQEVMVESNSRANSVERTLRERMTSYEQVLRGGAGLFQSSGLVTLDEWKRFLDAFNVDHSLIGVQGIGVVRAFEPRELPSITAFMKSQGVNSFKITPEGANRQEYATVLYIQPVRSAKNLSHGYDMYSEPLRRATMLRARDSKEISMTPLIELLPVDPKTQRKGFSMFAPYYSQELPKDSKQQRQSALEGYVYASFLSDVFFESIVHSADNQNVALRVTTRSINTQPPLYESPDFAKISHGPRAAISTRDVVLYGQKWTINFASDSRSLVSDDQLGRPQGVFFFGIFSAALISFIVLLLLRVSARDLSTQKEKAVELAKDELLSLASHQLRTPATGVKQYVGMVLQGFAGKISGSQKKLLEKAYASNDRQLRIINEILHLAKIGSGRIVLTKKQTNLNNLVKDILNEQRPDIESAKHTIKAELPSEPLIIQADSHILRMAIENLLSNAIKYTPAGGKIVVHVGEIQKHAFISVSDTGIGISPEDSGKIFHQFSRLPNSMTQKVGGTGIGLYLAKHLVELHNGSIKLKSKPGKGSTFTISMPRPKEDTIL